MICKRCIVSGRVQGVWYRASAQQRARELQVAGHARNLPDGRVEVVVHGEADAVGQFVAWLWIGSSASRVTAVECHDVDVAQLEHPLHFVTG